MVEIFYDGNCIVCSTEILFYKRKKPEAFKIVDISDESFRAETFNLNVSDVNKYMHVKNGDKVSTKVDAFVVIWEQLEGKRYRFLIYLSQNKIIRPIMDIGYIIFASIIRPILPKYK